MNKRRIIMVCLLGIVILLFLLGIKDIRDNNIKNVLEIGSAIGYSAINFSK